MNIIMIVPLDVMSIKISKHKDVTNRGESVGEEDRGDF